MFNVTSARARIGHFYQTYLFLINKEPPDATSTQMQNVKNKYHTILITQHIIKELPEHKNIRYNLSISNNLEEFPRKKIVPKS